MTIWLTIGLWILAGLICGAVFAALIKTGKPVRRLVGSGVQGFCALAAVNVAGAFTGVSLGINLLTGACALVLGIPGIIGLLVIKAIVAR
ncbi:MAG: pro-sigmaK processing inhibitor BofA family protein [Oscillospiraceae bacterium]|nr:pro-sigmaK processing inhibitor BofA family protein [Oscillospiraceae bacterium]